MPHAQLHCNDMAGLSLESGLCHVLAESLVLEEVWSWFFHVLQACVDAGICEVASSCLAPN